MTEEIIDDDDWVEVERQKKQSAPLCDVSVSLTIAQRKNGKVGKARAYLTFRGKAAEWIRANGPRFRVAVAGAQVNYLRITPDKHGGKFESWTGRGETERLCIGAVTAWPNEDRAPTEAKWSVEAGWMKLRLPEDFAIAAPVKPIEPPAHVRADGAVGFRASPLAQRGRS